MGLGSRGGWFGSGTKSGPLGLDHSQAGPVEPATAPDGLEMTTLAAGCFWGVEELLSGVGGVSSTVVGYTGGAAARPTYELVCSGHSGHAEAVLVTFDPLVVSYDRILEEFWRHHDPTTPNRQGPDVGTQYRSAVFTHSPDQERLARHSLEAHQMRFKRPIVTEVVPAVTFWPAEAYHQQYAARTGRGGCHVANW